MTKILLEKLKQYVLLQLLSQ